MWFVFIISVTTNKMIRNVYLFCIYLTLITVLIIFPTSAIRYGDPVLSFTTDTRPVVAIFNEMVPEYKFRIATGTLIHPRFIMTAFWADNA